MILFSISASLLAAGVLDAFGMRFKTRQRNSCRVSTMQPTDNELMTESEELDGVAELGLMPSVECFTIYACACPTA